MELDSDPVVPFWARSGVLHALGVLGGERSELIASLYPELDTQRDFCRRRAQGGSPGALTHLRAGRDPLRAPRVFSERHPGLLGAPLCAALVAGSPRSPVGTVPRRLRPRKKLGQACDPCPPHGLLQGSGSVEEASSFWGARTLRKPAQAPDSTCLLGAQCPACGRCWPWAL